MQGTKKTNALWGGLGCLFGSMLAWNSDVAASEHLDFNSVVARYQSDDRKSLVADMETIARQGRVEAALLTGLMRLDTKFGPPNRVEGLAWLQVAAQIDVWNEGTYEHAPQTLHELEPGFSDVERESASRRAQEILAPLVRQRNEYRGAARCVLLDRAEPMYGYSRPGLAGRGRGQGTLRCTGEVSEPEILPSARRKGAKVVMPEYPVDERDLGWDRNVEFAAHVDQSGYVCRVMILVSSGIPLLDKATLDAVARWRWSPAKRDGSPVESIAVEQATFRVSSGLAADKATENFLRELINDVVGH